MINHRILKLLLIFLTIVEIGFFVLNFSNNRFVFLNFFTIIITIQVVHSAIMALFLIKIWKNKLTPRKMKIDNTLMIIFLGIIGMWLWLPKEKKYDIDFSDDNLDKLTYACESLIELFEKNEVWDYIYLIKDINECALNYDFNGFREATTHHYLVGTAYSINDGVFEENDIDLKNKFKTLLQIISEIGHNHPNVLRTIKSL